METDGLTLTHWRLITDTAALVLIWLVQLVIYPAYTYQQREDFGRWHPVYTRRVTYVVMPIMLGQVLVYALLLWRGGVDWTVYLNTLLIAIVWAVTFFGAVPLHARLDDATVEDHLPASRRLNRINAWRTGLWTVVWGVSVWFG